MILHVSTSLANGGAESLLATFVTTDKSETHVVISLAGRAFYADQLEEAGITVHALDMPRSRVTIRGLWRLFRLIRHYDPRVIQAWMYHANFLVGILARLAGKNRIVWGLHNTKMDPAGSSLSVRLCDQACAKMSKWVPRQIVHCSESGAREHIQRGYSSAKMQVIPNGYDLTLYKPDSSMRSHVRNELGLNSDILLFGMIARFNPQKDHNTMLEAISLLDAEIRDRARFVFVGDGLSEKNNELNRMIDSANVRDHVVLLGPRRDIPALLNALDVHVLSSAFGESFPNVVNEAMACGVPCIVTDSGDSAMIVADTGWVVPPSDPNQLACALTASAEARAQSEWQTRKEACRHRVLENFTLERMIKNYQQIWSSI